MYVAAGYLASNGLRSVVKTPALSARLTGRRAVLADCRPFELAVVTAAATPWVLAVIRPARLRPCAAPLALLLALSVGLVVVGRAGMPPSRQRGAAHAPGAAVGALIVLFCVGPGQWPPGARRPLATRSTIGTALEDHVGLDGRWCPSNVLGARTGDLSAGASGARRVARSVHRGRR